MHQLISEFSRWHIEPLILSVLVRPVRTESLVDLGLALLPTRLATGTPICYTIGVGEDVEFERRLSRLCHARQWMFDPTPRSIQFMNDPRNGVPGATFMPVGIWSADCVMRFHAPANPRQVSHSLVIDSGAEAEGFTAQCRSVQSIMQQLNHDRIDLVKLNVEGAEDAILDSLLGAGVRPDVILVTWEGERALRKARRWTKRLEGMGWDFLGRKGWYFTYGRRG